MYQARYENPLEFTKDLFEQSCNELAKLFQQINYGFIQMYLNNTKVIKTICTMDKDFINVLNDDLDFPNAKSIIAKQVKSLASLIRGKKFDKFQTLVAAIKSELDVLGIVYASPLENSQIKSLVDE
jgi:cysteinyl-tRNA synthetase